DGVPVTADDVIFSINTASNPAVKVQDPSTLRDIVGATDGGLWAEGASGLSGVKKVDDHTLTIETKNKITLNAFLLTLGQWIRPFPKHIVEKIEPENIVKSEFFQKPNVTNGAMKFKEYVPSQYLALEANETYFKGRPKIDALNFKILSGTQITAQLESGEVDLNFPGVGYLPQDDYERLEKMPHINAKFGKPGNVQNLFYNTKVLNNVKLRQAMDLAIDRESILKNVCKGYARMTKTPVTNQIEYYNEGAAQWKFDLEAAKKLLDESGWDKKKQITFLVPTGNATRERVCTVVAENFKTLGLNVVIDKKDFPTTLASVQKKDYEISIIGIPDIPLNIIQWMRFYFHSQMGWTNYNNPRADKLYDILTQSVDAAEIKAAYYELQDILGRDLPVDGLYSEIAMCAVNKRLSPNVELFEYGGLSDLEQWDIVE
ncbi:MAG: ABC transporter substrate-binding protein, partial [Spirochaetaceae bacterium]|nr:ABC transporter substrate-binding protein [Spirochaetaceae bacterium]